MSRRGFRRSRGELLLRLEDVEREVVADLLLQLEAFVAPAPGGSDGDPPLADAIKLLSRGKGSLQLFKGFKMRIPCKAGSKRRTGSR